MVDKKPSLVFVFPDQFRQQSVGFLKQDCHYAEPPQVRLRSEGIHEMSKYHP